MGDSGAAGRPDVTPQQWRAWRDRVYAMPAADLTGDQKVVVLALAEFAGFRSGSNARPGVDRLASMCRVSDRTVLRALRAAEALKLIVKTGPANGRRGVCSVYRIATTGQLSQVVDENHRTAESGGDSPNHVTAETEPCDSSDQTTRQLSHPTNVRPPYDPPNNKPPYPPDDEPAPPAPVELHPRRTGAEIARDKFSATPVADNSAFAKRIARAYSDSLPVPIETGVLTKIGIEADKCLRSQIPPDAIAAGIREWADSAAWSPTQIPTFVAKAAARAAKTASGIGKPTEKALGYQAAGEALIARLESA